MDDDEWDMCRTRPFWLNPAPWESPTRYIIYKLNPCMIWYGTSVFTRVGDGDPGKLLKNLISKP